MSATYAEEPEHVADVRCWCRPIVQHYANCDVIFHRSLVECLVMFGVHVTAGPDPLLNALANYDFTMTSVPIDQIVILGGRS